MSNDDERDTREEETNRAYVQEGAEMGRRVWRSRKGADLATGDAVLDTRTVDHYRVAS